MKKYSFAGFEYRGLNNLGDNIQSIATERLFPEKVIQRFDRDRLAYANPSEPMKIVMNGWFSHQPQTCLPFNLNLEPVFWGFHITDYNHSWEYFRQKEVIAYLKQYEPIGCRDPYTADRLSQLGVETFVSYCLTLTLSKRECEPENGYIFVVDGDHIPLPLEFNERIISVSHRSLCWNRETLKRLLAKQLLRQYKTKATLVVTTRLHCLLPCIAMGIPVVFFNNPKDYRVSWVKDLGVHIYTGKDWDSVEWNPKPIRFSEKKKIIENFQSRILINNISNKIL